MMTDDKQPRKLISDDLVRAVEAELKDLIGAPMLKQLKDAVEKNFRKPAPPWSDVADAPRTTAPTASEADEFIDGVKGLVSTITYKYGYRLLCMRDQKDPQGRVYLQVECDRLDAVTGVPGVGRGGKAYLSEHMTDGEIVRKAFGLFAAYEEHECREFFKWDGRAIFGPHIDPHALWDVANRRETRD